MTIEELKQDILNGSVDDSLKIFTSSDNMFVVDEYIQAIAGLHKLSLTYVDNLNSFLNKTQDIFNIIDEGLYVYSTDNLQGLPSDLTSLTNVIIKTKKIDDTLKDKVKEYIVNFDKLEKWQITDYVKTRLPGLKQEEIEWLCTICNYDIYRLHNETEKIKIFNKNEQEKMFRLINEDSGYSDLSNLVIFDLINAILKKEKGTVREVLSSLSCIDVEPMGVVTMLKKQFNIILAIQSNAKVDLDSLGVSQKQFNAIKYHNCGYYKLSDLIEIYQMLCKLDYQLKSGMLDYDKMVDYIICNTLSR